MKEHQLQQEREGWKCERCEGTWKQQPTGRCPGVKIYSYTEVPWDSLATYTQLKRQKLKPADTAQAVGCYFRLKDKEYIYLYRIDEAVPRRVPTPKQREAIEKMRATLVSTHTCERCGWYDSSHGQYKRHVTTLKVSGEARRYCEDCRRYIIWSHDRHIIEENMAFWVVESSEAETFVILATSTVELCDHPAVIEVAVVDKTGTVLFHSLIKPDIAMPEEAMLACGLTDADLANAPSFAEVWPRLSEMLSEYDIWAYHAEFDRGALLTSAKRSRLAVPPAVTSLSRWHCLMEEFATYYGMWQGTRYKWQSLAVACAELGVGSHGHRAVPNALSALGVMQALAARGGSYPVPQEQPIDDGRGYDD